MVVGCALSVGVILLGRAGDERRLNRIRLERELAGAAQREAISRDVHDLLGHSLTVLTLKAEVAQRLVAVDPDRAEAELGEIVVLSRAALADVRATVSRLRAPALADQVTASVAALQEAGVRVRTHGTSPADLAAIPPSQAEVLAWALREATTNILRHAQASEVTIELARGLLRVSDDGVGLDRPNPRQDPTTDSRRPHGNGLAGLRERVEAAGGTLTVTDLAGDAVGPHAGNRPEGPTLADPAPLPTPSHGTVLEVRL